jgi:hypothetical protein
MSDDTVKHLSQDMATIVIQNTKPSPLASGTRLSQDDTENKPSLAVKDHWSHGFKLGGKSSTEKHAATDAVDSNVSAGCHPR